MVQGVIYGKRIWQEYLQAGYMILKHPIEFLEQFVIKYVIVPLFWLIILGIINWLTNMEERILG